MNYVDQNFVTILIYDWSLRIALYFEIYQMLCAFNFLWGAVIYMDWRECRRIVYLE